MLKGIHHVAIICSNLALSRKFYIEILGFKLVNETYRADRNSHKIDLSLDGNYRLELFTFPSAPARPSYPEAMGLRHIAFTVDNLDNWIDYLKAKNILPEPIRTDETTGKRFTFIADPDHLPIEFYEG